MLIKSIKVFLFFFLVVTTLFLSIKPVQEYIAISFDVENPNHIENGAFYYEEKGVYKHKNFSYENNKVDIKIYKKHIDSLRFDPMDKDGMITIKNITLNYKDVTQKRLTLKALHSIERITRNNDKITIISNGEDPYLTFIENINAYKDWKNATIDYSPIVFFVFFVFFYIFYGVFEKLYTEKNKNKILVFLIIYNVNILLIFVFSLFDFDQGKLFFAKVIFLDKFLIESFSIFLFIFLLLRRNKVFLFLSALLIYGYILITFAQISSFEISGEFLSILAMQNVEFIGYMLTIENSVIIIKLVLFLFVIPYIVSKYFFFNKKMPFILTTISLLLCIAIVMLLPLINSDNITRNKNIILKNVSIKHTGMVQAFLENFVKPKSLEDIDLKFIGQLQNKYHIHLEINPSKKYPLEKSYIYKKRLFKDRKNKPNIIIIFTEGLSARTISPYNKKFDSLTPNLQKFSDYNGTMKVINYYNHTAATYKGLHGQLCSLYPSMTGSREWLNSKINYRCLPGILSENGYKTTYLNVHYKDSSRIDEIMLRVGFNYVLSGEELASKYLGSVNKYAGYLLDNQAYNMLINNLKEKEKKTNENPFFFAMYTAETHAWTNVQKDKGGLIYKDGSYKTLNTIHNMDSEFGKFWKYFKHSKFFKNTIIIFTADHAHYHDLEYIKLMKRMQEKDYAKQFVDKIPLFIYTPYNDLAKQFNANSHTSINLAPTLLHYLNINNVSNSFLGQSLFEIKRNFGYTDIHFIKNGTMYLSDIPHKNIVLQRLLMEYIKYTQYLEKSNRLSPNINKL